MVATRNTSALGLGPTTGSQVIRRHPRASRARHNQSLQPTRGIRHVSCMRKSHASCVRASEPRR